MFAVCICVLQERRVYTVHGEWREREGEREKWRKRGGEREKDVLKWKNHEREEIRRGERPPPTFSSRCAVRPSISMQCGEGAAGAPSVVIQLCAVSHWCTPCALCLAWQRHCRYSPSYQLLAKASSPRSSRIKRKMYLPVLHSRESLTNGKRSLVLSCYRHVPQEPSSDLVSRR